VYTELAGVYTELAGVYTELAGVYTEHRNTRELSEAIGT
jgi:hypothetical protein